MIKLFLFVLIILSQLSVVELKAEEAARQKLCPLLPQLTNERLLEIYTDVKKLTEKCTGSKISDSAVVACGRGLVAKNSKDADSCLQYSASVVTTGVLQSLNEFLEMTANSSCRPSDSQIFQSRILEVTSKIAIGSVLGSGASELLISSFNSLLQAALKYFNRSLVEKENSEEQKKDLADQRACLFYRIQGEVFQCGQINESYLDDVFVKKTLENLKDIPTDLDQKKFALLTFNEFSNDASSADNDRLAALLKKDLNLLKYLSISCNAIEIGSGQEGFCGSVTACDQARGSAIRTECGALTQNLKNIFSSSRKKLGAEKVKTLADALNWSAGLGSLSKVYYSFDENNNIHLSSLVDGDLGEAFSPVQLSFLAFAYSGIIADKLPVDYSNNLSKIRSGYRSIASTLKLEDIDCSNEVLDSNDRLKIGRCLHKCVIYKSAFEYVNPDDKFKLKDSLDYHKKCDAILGKIFCGSKAQYIQPDNFQQYKKNQCESLTFNYETILDQVLAGKTCGLAQDGGSLNNNSNDGAVKPEESGGAANTQR